MVAIDTYQASGLEASRSSVYDGLAKRISTVSSFLNNAAKRVKSISPKAVAQAVFSKNTLTSAAVGTGVRAAMGTALNASGGVAFAAGAAATTSTVMSILNEVNKRTEHSVHKRGYWKDLARTSVSRDFYNTVSSKEFMKATAKKAAISAGVASGFSTTLALIPDSVSQKAVDTVSSYASKALPYIEAAWNRLPNVNLISAAYAAPALPYFDVNKDFVRLRSGNAADYGFTSDLKPIDTNYTTSFGFYDTPAYLALDGAQQNAADALSEAALDKVKTFGGLYENAGIAKAHIFATTPVIVDTLVAYSDALQASYAADAVDYGAVQDEVKRLAGVAADSHARITATSDGIWDVAQVHRAMVDEMQTPVPAPQVPAVDAPEVLLAMGDDLGGQPLSDAAPVAMTEAPDLVARAEPLSQEAFDARFGEEALAALQPLSQPEFDARFAAAAVQEPLDDAVRDALQQPDITVTELQPAEPVLVAENTAAEQVVVTDAVPETVEVAAVDFASEAGTRAYVTEGLQTASERVFDTTPAEQQAFYENPAFVDPIVAYGLQLAEDGKTFPEIQKGVDGLIASAGAGFAKGPVVAEQLAALIVALEAQGFETASPEIIAAVNASTGVDGVHQVAMSFVAAPDGGAVNDVVVEAATGTFGSFDSAKTYVEKTLTEAIADTEQVTPQERIDLVGNADIVNPIARYGANMAAAGVDQTVIEGNIEKVIAEVEETFALNPDVTQHVQAATETLEALGPVPEPVAQPVQLAAAGGSEVVVSTRGADHLGVEGVEVDMTEAFGDYGSARNYVQEALMEATEETKMVSLDDREALVGDARIVDPIALHGIALAEAGESGEGLRGKIAAVIAKVEDVFEQTPDVDAHIAAANDAIAEQGGNPAALVAQADTVAPTISSVSPIQGLVDVANGNVPSFDQLSARPAIIMDVAADQREAIFAAYIPDVKTGIMRDVLERLASDNQDVVAQAVKDLSHGAFNGEYGMALNREAAFALNELALGIDPDNGQALFNKGYALMHGVGTDVDLDSARTMFEQAVDAGYTRADDHLDYLTRVMQRNAPAPLVG